MNRYLQNFRKIISLIFFVSFTTTCAHAVYHYGNGENSQFSFYKPMYFLFYDEPVKFQISFKLRIHLPHQQEENNVSGLYFGYTQKSLWNLYDCSESAPFLETNYNPEFFYLIDLENAGIFKNIAFGYEHESNGVGGTQIENSRSWDRFYFALGLSFFEERLFFLGKIWSAWGRSENPEISKYMGFYELSLRAFMDRENYKSRFEIRLYKARNKPWRENLELGYTLAPIFLPFKLYGQVWHGYGETLQKYNEHTTTFRFGIRID